MICNGPVGGTSHVAQFIAVCRRVKACKKREPGRGHYDKDRPAIIAWVSRQGSVVV